MILNLSETDDFKIGLQVRFHGNDHQNALDGDIKIQNQSKRKYKTDVRVIKKF